MMIQMMTTVAMYTVIYNHNLTAMSISNAIETTILITRTYTIMIIHRQYIVTTVRIIVMTIVMKYNDDNDNTNVTECVYIYILYKNLWFDHFQSPILSCQGMLKAH